MQTLVPTHTYRDCSTLFTLYYNHGYMTLIEGHSSSIIYFSHSSKLRLSQIHDTMTTTEGCFPYCTVIKQMHMGKEITELSETLSTFHYV